MARFHMKKLFGNWGFEDRFSHRNGGTDDHDHLNGSSGRDVLRGGSGNDKMWGGSGNDDLAGGRGDDLLVGGFGADRVAGGSGNDVILSRSDSGEMVAAQDGTTRIFGAETAALGRSNDTLSGGSGADTFRFEGQVNAKTEIVAKHVNADGTIDWNGVTGENNNVHDHWVDGFGNDVIRDFNRGQGDKIEISAHTAELKSIDHVDANGDGKADYSLLTIISQQGNAGAHDEDLLGKIKVYGDLVEAGDVSVDAATVYGAYEKVGQLPAGKHYQLEDDGVLPNGGTDGGHHNEMAMQAAAAGADPMQQIFAGQESNYAV